MDPRIDRLRGLLAIGVMLGHAIDLAAESSTSPAGMLYSIALAARPYFGFICVVGFIVLSGYCIARSTMKRFSPGAYVFLRLSRLYPLLIVAVVSTAALEALAFNSAQRPGMWTAGLDVEHFFIALGGLTGFKGQFGALAPSYTISYELMYYVIWGLAMTAAAGRGRLGLFIAAAAAVTLIVLGDPLRAALGGQAGYAPRLAIALLPAWLLGAALALFQNATPMKVARFIPVWAMWIILAWVFAYGHDRYHKPNLVSTRHSDIVYFTIMSGLLVTTIAAWLARPAPVQNAADKWLGEISYPLFIIHGPVIIALQFAMNASAFDPRFDVTLSILVAVSFAAASLLVHLVERPVMAWRQRIRGISPAVQPES